MAMSQQMWRREQERKRKERRRRERRRRNCAIVVVLVAIFVVAFIIINARKNNELPQNNAVMQTAAPQDFYSAYEPYATTRDESDISMSFYKNSAFAGNALADSVSMYGILKETDFYSGVNVDTENIYNTTNSGGGVSVADQFKSKKFDKVFLSFGEKELSWKSLSQFKTYYRDFVEKLKEYQPSASIYLIAIPPVTRNVSNSDSVINMDNIKAYNKRIKSIAISEDVYYVDSVDALSDGDGFLPDGVSADGINLNKAAVIDLLYYTSREAYIPQSSDMIDSEDEDDEEEGDTKKENKDKPSPEPTVNVLKSSVSDRNRED